MPGASNCRRRRAPPPRARCSCAGASRRARTVTLSGAAPGVASAVRPGTPGGVEMGLEALGEDWSLSLLGPRDRLEGRRAPGLGPAPRGAARLARKRRASVLRRAAPQRHWPADPAIAGRLARRIRRAAGGGRRLAADALGRLWSCRPRCQIPDGCPARLPASAWSLCRRGPDGIAANWPWTASRRCCCSVRCPRRRCRWRRPGGCWRACTNRPSSGACATSCNWATRCSAASARSAPGAACCSPRNLRVPARNACWSIWRPSSSAPSRRSRNCRRDAWPACAKPSPTTCAEHRVASPSEHGAPGRSTLAVAPVAPGCSPRPPSA